MNGKTRSPKSAAKPRRRMTDGLYHDAAKQAKNAEQLLRRAAGTPKSKGQYKGDPAGLVKDVAASPGKLQTEVARGLEREAQSARAKRKAETPEEKKQRADRAKQFAEAFAPAEAASKVLSELTKQGIVVDGRLRIGIFSVDAKSLIFLMLKMMDMVTPAE